MGKRVTKESTPKTTESKELEPLPVKQTVREQPVCEQPVREQPVLEQPVLEQQILEPEGEEKRTVFEDLTFGDVDTTMSSFSQSIMNCTLASVDLNQTIGHYEMESTPIQNMAVPVEISEVSVGRKSLHDRIEKLKAVIADDDDEEEGLCNSNNFQLAIAKLTKTQEALVESIKTLSDQQSKLADKLEVIIRQQQCVNYQQDVQSSVVLQEAGNINEREDTPPPPHDLDSTSQHYDRCEEEQSRIGNSPAPEGCSDILEKKFGFSREELHKLSRKSCSEGNFAVKLLQVIFSQSELKGRNCNGKRGKQPLDKLKLGLIQEAVFKVYALNVACRPEVWKKCIIAIDEYLRRK